MSTASYLVGIDTGGTFTDAAVLDEATENVVAKAKAPTTHGNLITGVRGALTLALAEIDPADVKVVSVSTTLATNALVEGNGEPACLITMGFTRSELDKAGINTLTSHGTAKSGGPGGAGGNVVRQVPGGHTAHGTVDQQLDLAAVDAVLAEVGASVSAFAVASKFSVRNPAHELAVRDHIVAATGKPVTCSHELSAQLGGPRRALTALLNARLISMIADLVDAVRRSMGELGVDAPLMIVRGDGTLVSAAFAAQRPIETILSGPAASVIGAQHLATGLASDGDAIVIDIGGTTTDIATVNQGVPTTTTSGALVAGHRTMVEAVDMVTVGIGGDSEVRIDSRASNGPVLVGPRRAIPLCRLALSHPEITQLLERQLRESPKQATDARFLLAVTPAVEHGKLALDSRERSLLETIGDKPTPLAEAATTGLMMNAADRLRSRGVIQLATMTPTDATAVLATPEQSVPSRHNAIPHASSEAALLGAKVLARQSRSNGTVIADSPEQLATMIVDRLVDHSAAVVLDIALRADALPHTPEVGTGIDAGSLVSAGLAHHRGFLGVDVEVRAPLVAIGAPAHIYEPHVAQRLGAQIVLPDHHDVANAVGSVVGQVRIAVEATVSQPTKGQFRVHLGDQPSFGDIGPAREATAELLEANARDVAIKAGAGDVSISTSWEQTTAMVEGKEVFIEGRMVVTATGRPAL